MAEWIKINVFAISLESLNCQHSLHVLSFSPLLDVCHLFTFVRPSKLSTCHWAIVMQGPACSPRFGRIQIQADSKNRHRNSERFL